MRTEEEMVMEKVYTEQLKISEGLIESGTLFKVPTFYENKSVCPLCTEAFDDEDMLKHHVIWRAFGGTDFYNLIYICYSCHSKLTWGNNEDVKKLNFLCEVWLLHVWGLKFIYYSGCSYGTKVRFLSRDFSIMRQYLTDTSLKFSAGLYINNVVFKDYRNQGGPLHIPIWFKLKELEKQLSKEKGWKQNDFQRDS